ncbi:hypothetical protein ACQJBY_052447 [Aegilops geniculata]
MPEALMAAPSLYAQPPHTPRRLSMSRSSAGVDLIDYNSGSELGGRHHVVCIFFPNYNLH